ncbi:MAG: hypothetical protein VB060_13455 [Oscillibacter sp.]|nr:hypothetical protein [Oscillibacter sp.]MEA4994800.1 hypothetical protein [Oscillibacter sp.]MEA5039651.1 hypothetical protein [Clostridiaceae bacterium]
MEKVFEDYFSELQADMVSICLEYVSKKADMIYIYCSCEANAISSNFFYRINGMLVRKHKLNETLNSDEKGFEYDTSGNRQSATLNIINEDIENIKELCEKYNRKMPTEMKLIYNVKKNSLTANYKYDLIYSTDAEKTANDVANEWFDEIKREKI